MAYDSNVLRRATARLEEGRRARADQAERRRLTAYAKQPRLAQIDRELRATMASLVAASLKNGEPAGEAVRAIRSQNMDLQRERAVLLGAMGLPEDALDDKPACPKCGDTGWRGANMCTCLQKLCAQEQISELSKLLDLGDQSFDVTFPDEQREFCVEFSKEVPASSLKMVIDSVYQGTDYADTCINEVDVYGY